MVNKCSQNLNLKTCWWTHVKGVFKLKESGLQDKLCRVCRTPEAGDHAMCIFDSHKGKTQMSFSRPWSKTFSQENLAKCLVITTLSVVGQLKNTLRSFLVQHVSTNVPGKKQGQRTCKWAPIPVAEVDEAVKQRCRSIAPAVDEILPEFLKTMHISGLSWLTHVQYCMDIVDSASRAYVPATGTSNSLASLGRFMPRCWRVPQVQEEQCGFCPSWGALDQLYTLSKLLKGAFEIA